DDALQTNLVSDPTGAVNNANGAIPLCYAGNDTFRFVLADDAGAIFTFILTLRKQPGTPRWVFVPLVGAGIYALLGGAIPGPADELLVDTVALILAWLGTRQKTLGEAGEQGNR
ncbi:MAG: hypothetical protein MUO62_09455, partial [Anaerolineales bacterium]|nr:hypothetical protein [Anaerolineales bacterium]